MEMQKTKPVEPPLHVNTAVKKKSDFAIQFPLMEGKEGGVTIIPGEVYFYPLEDSALCQIDNCGAPAYRYCDMDVKAFGS